MNDIQNNIPNVKSKAQKLYRICAPLFFVISVAAAILVFTLSYNADTGYLINSPLAILLTVIVISELATAAAISFFSNNASECDNNIVTRIATLISHIALLVFGVMALIKENGAIYSLPATTIAIIKAIFLILCIAAFLTNPTFTESCAKSKIFPVVNLCSTTVLCIAAISLLYFDLSVEMNNPQKLYIQFSAASVCLSSLFEVKSLVNNKGAKLSSFFKLSTIALSPIAVVSAITAYTSGDKFFSDFYFFFSIILAIYALTYLCRATIYNKEEK